MLPRSGPFLALAFLGGCNILLPYSPGANDRSRDRQLGDGWRDALWGEGPRPDRRLVDLPRNEAGCSVESLDSKLSACGGGPCGDPNNPDCDGLPGKEVLKQRDYYPTQCNTLRFEDDFSTEPSSSSWFHPATTYQGNWSWKCGWYDQTATGGTYPDPMNMAWARSLLAVPKLPNADYLVEARVQLGPIGNANMWGVGIVGRYSSENPFANIVCEIRVDAGSSGLRGEAAVPTPDVRIETRVGNTAWSAGWPRTRNSTLSAAAGKVYYLQLWYTKNFTYDADSASCQGTGTCRAIVCRACEESQCIRDGIYAFWLGNPTSPDMTLLPTAPGSVGLRTYGRAASFDYIRVYQLNDP